MNRVIAIKGPGGAVLVGAQQRGPLVLAGMPQSSRRVISAGQLGPAGLPGEPGPPGAPGSGSGVSYMQDHPPLNPLEQETWYSPLTLQLKVYTAAAGWQPVSPDGGHF